MVGEYRSGRASIWGWAGGGSMLYLGTEISTRISIKTFGRTTPHWVDVILWTRPIGPINCCIRLRDVLSSSQ